jgi:uncharacterized protein
MFAGYIGAMVLATFVGLALGALGGGGSIITTPLLVYVAHIQAEIAIGMSLMIVGTTSLIGAILHLRRGNLALRPAILFCVTGTVGSFLGSTGTHLLSRRSLLLLFSGLMLVVGIAMWRKRAFHPRPEGPNTLLCLAAGFAVGLLTGFLGVGGGFLIVPSLMLFAGLDTRLAAGTSLAVIAFNSATGLLGQLRYIQIDWRLLSGFLLFTIGGMVAGSTLSGKIPEPQLRRIFAAAVIVLGTAIGIENLLP